MACEWVSQGLQAEEYEPLDGCWTRDIRFSLLQRSSARCKAVQEIYKATSGVAASDHCVTFFRPLCAPCVVSDLYSGAFEWRMQLSLQ